MSYHHGGLREAIIDAAAEAIEREGVAALSLRALARQVGVTHAAPRHHFGGKRGVVTALAAQGYRRLAADVRRANDAGSLLESGVAYTEFARTHPAHFSVMFRPDMVDTGDPELVAALDELYAALSSGVRAFAGTGGGAPADVESLARAAWSIAHGFATLARSGNFRLGPGQSEADLARETLRHLRP
jgi:AcrR family transcriptional regulator